MVGSKVPPLERLKGSEVLKCVLIATGPCHFRSRRVPEDDTGLTTSQAKRLKEEKGLVRVYTTRIWQKQTKIFISTNIHGMRSSVFGSGFKPQKCCAVGQETHIPTCTESVLSTFKYIIS